MIAPTEGGPGHQQAGRSRGDSTMSPKREAQATQLGPWGGWARPPSAGRSIAGLRDCELNTLPNNLLSILLLIEVLINVRISSLYLFFPNSFSRALTHRAVLSKVREPGVKKGI